MPVSEKTCPRCQTLKPALAYYAEAKRKDGLHHICKACAIEKASAWNKGNSRNQPPQMDGSKLCTRCGLSKPVAEFNRAPKKFDGRMPDCAACKRAYDAKHRERHRER